MVSGHIIVLSRDFFALGIRNVQILNCIVI